MQNLSRSGIYMSKCKIILIILFVLNKRCCFVLQMLEIIIENYFKMHRICIVVHLEYSNIGISMHINVIPTTYMNVFRFKC